MRPGMTALGLLACLAVAPPTMASDTHYEDFVIGTRSVGLGGAFAGLANDPSGLWINPAGMNFSRRYDINISTSFYGFEFSELDVVEAEAQRSKDTRGFSFFDDLRVLPVTFGGVFSVGDQRPDRTFTHSIGFLIVFPDIRDKAQEREGFSSTPEGDERSYYKHNLLDRTLCAGVGYAYRVSDLLSVGGGLFYVNRFLERTDEVNHQFSPADGGAMEFVDDRRHLVHSSHSLMVNLGARLDLSEDWSLGLSLQSPTIKLGGETDLEIITNEARRDLTGELITGSGTRTFFDDDVNSARPFNLRLGVAFEYPETLTATADVVVYAPTRYRVFGIPEGEAYLPVPGHVERQAVVNVHAGFEYLVMKELSVAIGAFTNLTSAPTIPAQPDAEMLPHLNQFGLTLATGYYLKHSLVRLGFSLMYGDGHDVVAIEPDWRQGTTGRGFARVDHDRITLHVYLASTFRY